MVCPVKNGDHVLVSHAEFVARRHRLLRVIDALTRLIDDDPATSPLQGHAIEQDTPTAGSPRVEKAHCPRPLAFPTGC